MPACQETAEFSTPAAKKHKTASAECAGKKKKTIDAVIKTVKTVDPVVIEQRREAVQSRVLKLESKLAKDRALLARYSVSVNPAPGHEKDSGEDEEQGSEPGGVGDE